jgi:holo-[acyl-carrier protein] synthase
METNEHLLYGRAGSMSTGTAIRVGADVVAVQQVATSVENFGTRYLERVYTEHELNCCGGSPTVRAASLAARFAAKEATIKVLRPSGHQPDWRSVEVRRHSDGWCTIALTGHAAALADRAGIGELAVSLTHEGDVAAAVVVALCRADDASNEQPGLPVDLDDFERDD